MATQQRQQPSRLFIPPMLNSQLANSMDTRPMFSPALHTAHQQGFPPLPSAHPYNQGFPMHTPMQQSFFPPPHNAPPRQMHHGHRTNGSMAHIPSVGMHPPMPMTPFGSQFPPQMMHGGPVNVPPGQPFVPKSRRTNSMIGGPPKAALGGPNRKVSPLPPSAQVAFIAEKLKTKRIPVKIPVESEREEDESNDASKKSLWSRKPIHPSELETPGEIQPPEISTGALYPDEAYKMHLPPSVDVFLPGKGAWDEMKQREIDEKLERLGIERRSEFDAPELFGPRGRAASVSSPADPALLMFKLNKLHKQQSASNSLSPSPHAQSASVSPNSMFPPHMQTHGHSMSLAHSPSSQHAVYNGFGAKNGTDGYATSSEDGMAQASSPIGIYAPQGRIPAQLSVPSAPSRAESRPDFARGFGLDIPEEDEEEEERRDTEIEPTVDSTITEQPKMLEDDVSAHEAVQPTNVQINVAAPNEGTHTRHASRISVALSVGSVSKNLDETLVGHSRQSSMVLPAAGLGNTSEAAADPLQEWTGSESAEDVSDDESIGEWSNPSDEERARQERHHRRYLRRLHRETQEAPRRLPEFPRPPADQYNSQIDEEDIISNPSDEGQPMAYRNHTLNGQQYPQSFGDENARSGRPLPPLPHSRDPSNQYSYYGSLPSHSRGPSDHFTSGQLSVPTSRPESTQHVKTSSFTSSNAKKDLNPFAKPFVFGTRPGRVAVGAPASVPASVQSEAASSPAQVSAPSHSRGPSFTASKQLNAAAQEFKPGGFNFRPPDGVPQLAFPEPAPEVSRPLPEPPIIGVSRAMQGREKRQRTSVSNLSYESDETDDEVGHESMASFRFPPEPPTVFAHSAPTSPSPAVNRGTVNLNASAKPFTFSGFSNLPPSLPPLLGQEQRSLTDAINATDFLSINATRGSGLVDDQRSPDLTMPSMQKQKRAPIPLDFKHPISTNMVPAGLFKNLASGDIDSARAARAQSGSLEFSEVRSDVSLDDLSMPAISRKITRRVAKPEDLDMSQDDYGEATSDGGSQSGRTSEATQPNSPRSQISMVPPDVTSYSQGLRLAERLESVIDHKMDILRHDLVAQIGGGGFISASTDDLVKEAMAMFRTQLRDSAAKGMADSSMDAGGELDFEMIRGIVEQGHEDNRRHIQEDLAMILKNIKDSEGSVTPGSILELIRSMQELKSDVLGSNAHVSERLGAIEMAQPYSGIPQDRESLVLDILSALTPHLAAIRSEPIDYEGLTAQLSQAVKPHISQLIDLASDKRETASLIVEQLMPVLQSIASTPTVFDTGNLVSEITATVNRVIAPIDTHAVKEQVADLVVERLDSRLATRDNSIAVNFDGLKNKVTETISPLLSRFDSLSSHVKTLNSDQGAISTMTREFSTKQSEALVGLAGLSGKLGSVTDTLADVQSLLSQQGQVSDSRIQQLDRIETSIGGLGSSSEGLTKEEREEILSINRKILAGLNPISMSIASSVSSQEAKHGDLLSRLQSIEETSQDIRRVFSQNSELQSQLNKARSQHGLLRVQNEGLSGKLSSIETERDQLRTKVEELQAASLANVADFAALEARNGEQERAMHAALDRLKISDVNAQAQQERIAELERSNREVSQENQQLRMKVGRLEMQAEFAVNDRESTLHALKLLQEDRDRLADQQSHWEEFRQTAEQIETLANLMSKAESEEIAELKRVRDQSKLLEGEHAALKKRFKEQESKITSAERASATARQNLAQAQQRSADWESKAREYEGEVERLTTALDQGEQTKNQLDADCSLAKLQLEEREAENRIAKDRERKLEEQIASLKAKVSNLNSELEGERKVSRAASSQWRQSRGRSRASTEYEASEPPTPRINGKTLPASGRSVAASPPKTSTMDSMHAPRHMPTPYMLPPVSRSQRSSLLNSRAPSPTPSTMSVVTQGDDGWYS